VATLIGFVISGERGRLPVVRELVLLLALFSSFTINTAFALFPDDAREGWSTVAKIVLMTVMTIWLISTQARLRGLLWVLTISLGVFAIKAVPWGIRTGGQWILWGPEGTFVGANNAMGLAFNMLLPLMLFLAMTEERRPAKIFFYVMFCSSIFGVILTHSRGAFLGLVAVLFLLVWRTPHKLLSLSTLGIILLILLVFFVPQKWFDRMETILDYQSEGSAMSRIETWKWGWQLALRHPLTGGGFYAYQANPLGFDAHSVYFGMLGEQGFVSLLLFAALILCSWNSMSRVRRLAAEDADFVWYGRLAGMVQVSLVGYLVNGLTLNKQYFDLFYVLVAIVIIVKELVQREAEQKAGTTDAEPLPRVA
jgi:probable O-glycosylation ligase (exosortase A-associated)